jgi:hypothetical protein
VNHSCRRAESSPPARQVMGQDRLVKTALCTDLGTAWGRIRRRPGRRR